MKKQLPALRSGDGKSTQIGFVNENRQKVHGTTGKPGTDYGQYAYLLECLECHFWYEANGTDIWERKCPICQGGAPGIP